MWIGRNKEIWEILFDDFGLKEGMENAFKTLVATSTKENLKRLVPKASPEILVTLAEANLKPFIGAVVLALVKMLLEKNDRLQPALEKQFRAPLETGVRMISDGITLSDSKKTSIDFRNNYLLDGITELERACISEPIKRTEHVARFEIRLLQGLAATLMDDGTRYAEPRFQ